MRLQGPPGWPMEANLVVVYQKVSITVRVER